jgi:hypothetical protein
VTTLTTNGGLAFALLLAAHLAECFHGLVVRAKNHIGFELADKVLEPPPGATGKKSFDAIQPSRDLGVVGLGEDHAPKFRRAGDELGVAVGV